MTQPDTPAFLSVYIDDVDQVFADPAELAKMQVAIETFAAEMQSRTSR